MDAYNLQKFPIKSIDKNSKGEKSCTIEYIRVY